MKIKTLLYSTIISTTLLTSISFAQECNPDMEAPIFTCTNNIEIIINNPGEEYSLSVNDIISIPTDNCTDETSINYGFDIGSSAPPQTPELVQEVTINCQNTGNTFLIRAIDESENTASSTCSIVLLENCNCTDTDQDETCNENDDDDDNDGVTDEDELEGCELLTDCDEDGINDNEDTCPDTPGQKKNGGCPLLDLKVVGAEIINQTDIVEFSATICKNNPYNIINTQGTTIPGEMIVGGSIKGTSTNTEDYNLLTNQGCLQGPHEVFNKYEIQDQLIIRINTGEYTNTAFPEANFANNTIQLTLCTDSDGNISLGTPDCPDPDGNNDGLCILDTNNDGFCDPYTTFEGQLETNEINSDQLINIDNRSENCESLQIEPTILSCNELGNTSIQITATNTNQNNYSCTVTGTLSDITKPTVECNPEITIQPMENESITINYKQIITNSGDNCNIDTIQIINNQTNLNPLLDREITCKTITEQELEGGEITILVTDSYGLTGTCTSNITFDTTQCNIECIDNKDCKNENDICINQHCYGPDHPCFDLGGDTDQDGICDDDENSNGTDPENPCDPNESSNGCCLESGLGGNNDDDTLCNDQEEHPGCIETNDCDGDGIPDDQDDCDLEYEENSGCIEGGSPICQ